MLTTLTARPTLQTLHEDQLEPLVRRTLEGEPQAWRELWCAVDPTIEALAGRFRAGGRLAARDDERRNVVVRVMERLREGGFARLRTFHTVLLRRDGSFRAWLAVVTRRSALNNARDHAENLGASADSAHRRWVELLPLPEAIEDALPVSTRAAQTAEAVRIETYIEQHIPPATGKRCASGSSATATPRSRKRFASRVPSTPTSSCAPPSCTFAVTFPSREKNRQGLVTDWSKDVFLIY